MGWDSLYIKLSDSLFISCTMNLIMAWLLVLYKWTITIYMYLYWWLNIWIKKKKIILKVWFSSWYQSHETNLWLNFEKWFFSWIRRILCTSLLWICLTHKDEGRTWKFWPRVILCCSTSTAVSWSIQINGLTWNSRRPRDGTTGSHQGLVSMRSCHTALAARNFSFLLTLVIQPVIRSWHFSDIARSLE